MKKTIAAIGILFVAMMDCVATTPCSVVTASYIGPAFGKVGDTSDTNWHNFYGPPLTLLSTGSSCFDTNISETSFIEIDLAACTNPCGKGGVSVVRLDITCYDTNGAPRSSDSHVIHMPEDACWAKFYVISCCSQNYLGCCSVDACEWASSCEGCDPP